MNRARQSIIAGWISAYVFSVCAAGACWADATTLVGGQAPVGQQASSEDLSREVIEASAKVRVVAEPEAAANTHAVAENAVAEATVAIDAVDPPGAVSDVWDDDVAAFNYGAEDPLADISLLALAAKLGLGLVLVVLLALGGVYVLRRSSLGRKLGSLGSAIRVIERTYLGPKKAVFLVQIGNRTLALGVTDSNISSLSEWSEGELELVEADARPASFAHQLKSMLGRPAEAGQEVAQ